ncbi:MAG TPA: galactokinase [Mycobacteriales bacterium]|nr:galactokinase [Mycobacteriales bacterium]
MSTVTWTAPGRLNLIGEHTDYNDGFVLPLALPYATTATVTTRADGELRLRSAQRGAEDTTLRVDGLAPGTVRGWAAYAAGVVWALREAGHEVSGGFDVEVDGDVPEGAGLSSSAALECAVAAAVADLGGLELARSELALVAQRAENDFVGMPSGVMDQMASMLCTEAHALFLDCRSLAAEQVPLDVAAAGLTVLVVDTRTPHQLTDSAYGARRAACEDAARRLGVPALRDVPVAELDAALARLADDEQRRRVRHVVTEDDRVLRTVEALRAGRTADVGPLLSASHASLRDDYEVTVPQLDVAAAAAEDAGALGARMTGGGFGGCVLALVAVDRAEGVREAVRRAYADAGFGPPGFFEAVPSAGARRR